LNVSPEFFQMSASSVLVFPPPRSPRTSRRSLFDVFFFFPSPALRPPMEKTPFRVNFPSLLLSLLIPPFPPPSLYILMSEVSTRVDVVPIQTSRFSLRKVPVLFSPSNFFPTAVSAFSLMTISPPPKSFSEQHG